MVTRRLEHENGEARAFYATLPKPSLIGIEATGYTHWFERLVAELGHELWVGDPAEIRARAVRRQKTDTRDAEHLLDLLLTKRFPELESVWEDPRILIVRVTPDRVRYTDWSHGVGHSREASITGSGTAT